MADLSRVESMQYPQGHLSHLTDNQQARLDEFKQICQDADYWTPGNMGKPPSHDDETMLRYLRARRFVPQEAFKQFKDTEDWRKDNKLSEIFNTIETEEYEQTRRLYPQWLGRRDKRGIPLFLFEVAPLNSKNISAYEKDLAKSKTVLPNVATKNVRLFALYESLTRFVTPLCSMVPRNHPETPISQSNNIVDISGVGLKQFWNLKAHMQDASVLATAHYPETLDRIFIVGAPGFFPTVWGWIKRWFDPITVSKIFILSPANVYATLSQYIDHENIPIKYGGGLDFNFGSMPNLEPAIEQQLVWENPNMQNGKKTMPIGPIKWEEGPLGEMQAWGVGNENGKPRRQLIFTVPKPVGYTKGGPTAPNTPAFQIGDPLTTVGTATHPPDTAETDVDLQTPPSDSDESSLPADSRKSSTVAPGTLPAPAPAPEPASSSTSPPATTAPSPAPNPPTTTTTTTTLPIRQGTSATRFEQQSHTLAAGQLASGTPSAALNDHGHGDTSLTVEPATVGQAPKELPKPSLTAAQAETDPAQPVAPGYLEQAQSAAASATAAVSSTLGSVVGAVTGAAAGKVEEPVERVKTPEEQALERKIDETKDVSVEAFLREKSRTG